MDFIEKIRNFWNTLFSFSSSGDIIAAVLTVLTVLLIPIYALGVLKYFDALFYRVSQLLVRPINLLIYYLDKSATSIDNMKFKHHIANTVLVIAAFGMIITEYSMIQEFLQEKFSGSSSDGSLVDFSELGFDVPPPENSSSQVNFLGLFSISTSSVLSITYIAIATILGFFTFELNSTFRSIFHRVFEPDSLDNGEEDDDIKGRRFFIFSMVFLLPLVILAFIQGFLGYEREVTIAGGDDHSIVSAALLVVTGFLIPIVAGIGLMALHTLFAQVAFLAKVILEIIKDIVIAICLQVIALIDFLSALITKTVMLFLGVEGDIEKALEYERKVWNGEEVSNNIWIIQVYEKCKAAVKIRFLKRLRPVDIEEDTYSIYVLDKLDFQSEYRNAFWKKSVSNSFQFICSEPSFKIEKKFDDVFQLKTTFGDISNEIAKDYQVEVGNIEFKVKDNTFLRVQLKDVTEIKREKDLSKILIKDLIGYDTFYTEIKSQDKEIDQKASDNGVESLNKNETEQNTA